MFIAANFLIALAQVVDYLLWAYMWIVVARAVISWVNPDPYNPIVRLVVRVTEPVLGPVRNLLPALGGFDFSPILVLIAIQLLENLLIRAIVGLSM